MLCNICNIFINLVLGLDCMEGKGCNTPIIYGMQVTLYSFVGPFTELILKFLWWDL
jgi:hypothetical protein